MAQKISKKDLRDRFPEMMITHSLLFNREKSKFGVIIQIKPSKYYDLELDCINDAERIYSELKKHFNFSNL